MTYCPTCGTELANGWDVCRGCGRVLRDVEEQARPAWRFHPGKNWFFFRGHCMTSTRLEFAALNLGLNVVVFTLFCVFDLPYLISELSPAIAVFGALFFVLTMTALFSAGCSDPGIIPRGNRYEVVGASGDTQVYRTAMVLGVTINLRFCRTCQIYRPPRATHCRICDNCVEKFDHHCPWVGNCVADRNYRFFVFYVFWQLLLSAYVCAFSAAHLGLVAQDRSSFHAALRATPISVPVIVISFCAGLMILWLAGYHYYLISGGITTNEDIKGSRSPYDKGYKRNWLDAMYGVRRPSRVLVHEVVPLGSLPSNRSFPLQA